MGNNLNLCRMLNIPNVFQCPECGSEEEQDFDDYDMECGDPNESYGEWRLRASCLTCGHEWDITFKVIVGCVLNSKMLRCCHKALSMGDHVGQALIGCIHKDQCNGEIDVFRSEND